tara:strand:+ start:1142 stop:2299 length:1158 start_codon:yes stop_codon:yes gene_type:complete
MAKKKKEEVVEETIQENVVEETTTKEDTPKVDLSKFDSKDNDEVFKVDLSKPIEEKKEEVPLDKEKEEVEEIKDNAPVLEEITEEKTVEEVEEVITDAVVKAEETGTELPENIQKLVSFMNETGGDLNDYINLNKDYSELDNNSLLKEYYHQTKPHLDSEEIEFLMEDNFSFDEDVDDTKDIKRKKLALKEQVANAKTHLEENKSKYYEDIKYGSKLTGEQREAVEFFNRYNEESNKNQEVARKQHDLFSQRTNNVFNDKFKGFEYNIGEKKFRFNVKDADKVKDTQSDISNFVGKFLNKNNEMEDARGYHKSLFTAMNADAIANHFYEQGKADATKDSIAKSKNISMDPRQQHSGEINASGIKVRVLGDNSNDFKFKIKPKKTN